jgi:CelD/BcsL family acetyltransferase involved in cellulose biosynthesis
VRRAHAHRLDELALVGVRQALFEDLAGMWPVKGHEGHLSESPYVALSALRGSGKPYLSTLSANMRSQLTRSVRLYTELFGPVEVRVANGAEEIGEWYEAMVELHSRRWKLKGELGAFADPVVRRFHRGLLESCAGGVGRDGLVAEILRVRFGLETVAFLYHLRYRRRINFLQSGLAYHEDNRLKPGLVAHALSIERYRQSGDVDEYDFLGGEPEAVRYKRSLATDRRTLAWVELPSPALKMRGLRYLRHVRRRARAWLR